MTYAYAAFTYLVLISFFYYWTQGFVVNRNNLHYCLLKMTPVSMLSIFCFIVGKKVGLSGQERFYTAIALCAGAVGDYIIGHNHKGLWAGAIAFGIGHFFYILTFYRRLKTINKYCAVVIPMCSLLIGYNTVMRQFSKNLLSNSVLMIYACLLTTCLVLAASLFFNGGIKQAPRSHDNGLLFSGYLLFYISDSLIAVNSMRHPFPHAHKFILFTYFAAQYLIFWSICESHKGTKPAAAVARVTSPRRARVASTSAPKATKSIKRVTSPPRSTSPRKAGQKAHRTTTKATKKD